MRGRLYSVVVLFSCFCFAQPSETWDVTKARGHTRDIDFTTSEGTWMSVDISPTGNGSPSTCSDRSTGSGARAVRLNA